MAKRVFYSWHLLAKSINTNNTQVLHTEELIRIHRDGNNGKISFLKAPFNFRHELNLIKYMMIWRGNLTTSTAYSCYHSFSIKG